MTPVKYTGFDELRAGSEADGRVRVAIDQHRLSKVMASGLQPYIEQAIADAVAEAVEVAKKAAQTAGAGAQWSVEWKRDGLDRPTGMTITRVK